MDTWSRVGERWVEGEQDGATGVWFNFCGPEPELHDLAARFGLHPLAVEDCVSTLFHAPKIDEFSDHLFIVLQMFIATEAGPRPVELDCFLGSNFLLTYGDEPIPALGEVIQELRDGLVHRPGCDGLLYAIVDRATDRLLPLSNTLSSRLDEIEIDIVEHGGVSRQGEILQLRSQAGVMRRLLLPQLTVLQRLSRGEFELILESNRIYYRDVYDHLLRTDLALEGIREDTEVALSTYLSAINNRLSEVMKVLSVVGALALPASVIAGIFGTNFDNVPGLHSNAGFFLMLGAMFGVAVAMAYYFYRKDWF